VCSAKVGESDGGVADSHVAEVGGCATPGAVDATIGCGLYEGTLDAQASVVDDTGSGLSVGDAGAWGISVGAIGAQVTIMGDGGASAGIVDGV
jgi:hypothetical protein